MYCCLVEEMEEPSAVALFEVLCSKGVHVVKSKDERKKKSQQVRISIIEKESQFVVVGFFGLPDCDGTVHMSISIFQTKTFLFRS